MTFLGGIIERSLIWLKTASLGHKEKGEGSTFGFLEFHPGRDMRSLDRKTPDVALRAGYPGTMSPELLSAMLLCRVVVLNR